MNRHQIALRAMLGIAPFACGQSPSFEVASIKPNHSADHRTQVQMTPGGRFNARNISVKMLMMMAYQVKNSQISGAPGWMDSEFFDISAKPEGSADQEQIRLMMQSLLAERFQMKFHRETKEQPVFALVIDKSGSKLKETTGEGDLIGPAPEGGRGPAGGRGAGMPGGGRQGVMVGRGQIQAQGAQIAMLANQLSNVVGRQVIDKTGLTGSYDFKLTWTPEEGQGMRIQGDNPNAAPPAASADSGPTIFSAVQEQLGLKLESQRGPVEIFTIDRVEKPSEN